MTYLGKLKLIVIFLLLIGAVTTNAIAQSPPSDTIKIDQIINTLNNMGYSPSNSQGTVTFTADSYYINAQISSDGSIVYLSLQYGINSDQVSKIPAIKLLIFNETHRDYIYLQPDNKNVPTGVGIYIQILSSAFSTKEMRLAIDDLTGDASANQAILNPSNW